MQRDWYRQALYASLVWPRPRLPRECASASGPLHCYRAVRCVGHCWLKSLAKWQRYLSMQRWFCRWKPNGLVSRNRQGFGWWNTKCVGYILGRTQLKWPSCVSYLRASPTRWSQFVRDAAGVVEPSQVRLRRHHRQ